MTLRLTSVGVSLDSKKFWAKKLAHWINRWRHPKKNAKPTPILMSSTKNHKPETKIIFFILHTRLSKSLHGLNSSLAQSAGKLWLLAKMTKVTICGIWIYIQFLVCGP